MGEVIQLSFGQTGIRIGAHFWEAISKQHNIDFEGVKTNNSAQIELEYPQRYFQVMQNNRYVPRAILVDLQPSSINIVKCEHLKKLFSPINIISGDFGSQNSFGTGYYLYGNQIADILIDNVRKQVEKCDRFSAFQISHSISGGTGSGLLSLFMRKIYENYSHDSIHNYSVFPSNEMRSPLETYNSVFAMNHLIQMSDNTTLFSNQSLSEMCSRQNKFGKPTFKEMNKLVSNSMVNISSVQRFPGLQNASFRKITVNLIPFPRLHFFITGISSNPFSNQSLNKMVHSSFHYDNYSFPGNHFAGHYFAAAGIFRGNISTSQIDLQMHKMKTRHIQNFLYWIPDSTAHYLNNVPPKQSNMSVTSILNSTSIHSVFKELTESWVKMFRRKSFIYHYLSRGMDEMQFVEAESNLNDLISQYQSSQQFSAGYGQEQ